MDVYTSNEELLEEFEDDNMNGRDAGILLGVREANDTKEEEPSEDY